MMDDDEFPFDMDAAIEDEENMMYEEMYEENADYMEPDDIEKEMHAATSKTPAPSGIDWTGGKKPLYSPPARNNEFKPAVATPVEDISANFDSARPVGQTNTGHLFALSSPFATKSDLFRKVSSSEYLHDRPETGNAHLTTVLQDGSRFFLRPRKEKDDAERSKRPATGTLLGQSMQQLSLDADRLQRGILTSKKKNLDADTHAPLLANESSLWVDKYSPRLFSQLLSSEKTNRDVLKALKQWDNFVFVPKSKQNKGDSRPFQKVILLCGPPGTGKTTIAHVVAQHCGYRPMEMNASDDRSVDALRETIGRAVTASTLDKDKRPNCVILDEIDGIDGRAPIDALIDIIKAPLKAEKKGNKSGNASKSGWLALTRPMICICNDLFSPQLRELRKHAQVFVFSSPLEMRLVQRLRNVCLSEGIQVQSGALSLLCAATGYDIRSSINTLQFASLKSKADRANGATGTAGHVGAVLMSMLSTGLKDVDKDLFQVWKEIFWLKESARVFSRKKRNDLLLQNSPDPAEESKRTRAGNSGSSGRGMSVIDVASLRMIRDSEFSAGGGHVTKPGGDSAASRPTTGHALDVIDSVIGFGDHELVMHGLFENYLGIRYQDPAMSRTSTSVDWLCDADLWQGRFGDALSDGRQTLKYVPLVAGAVHLLCSAGTRPELKWPRKESNMRFARQQRESIVHSVIEGTPQHNLSLRQKVTVATEVIPFLYDIITPHVRPAAMQTLSNAEQEQLKNAAAVMASCGIRYEYQSSVLSSMLSNNAQEETEGNDNSGDVADDPADTSAPKWNNNGMFLAAEQESLFHLTPAITELLSYEPVAELKGRRRVISPELKNLFYLETQKAMISAKHDAHEKMEVVESDVVEPIGQSNNAIHLSEKAAEIKLPPALPATSAPKGSGMFFSKSAITKKRALENPKGDSAAAAAVAAKKQLIRFKFSQGFSAAVKRPVKVAEFL